MPAVFLVVFAEGVTGEEALEARVGLDLLIRLRAAVLGAGDVFARFEERGVLIGEVQPPLTAIRFQGINGHQGGDAAGLHRLVGQEEQDAHGGGGQDEDDDRQGNREPFGRFGR